MHALREQAESGGDKVAVCWWYGQFYDVSSWWTAEERQKGQTNTANMRAEIKPKKTRADRNEVVVFVEFGFVTGVSRWSDVCDIARNIAIYRDIMSRIMRYHKIRYIEISYHIYIPSFWDWYGDIVSRRFLDTEHYFLPVRCTKLSAPRE